jgi:hypothetical protein
MKKIFFYLFLILIICAIFFISKGIEKKTAESRFDYFYNLTLKDPLFYSPFLDSGKFNEAIVRLNESESQLKDVYIRNFRRTLSSESEKAGYFIPILAENTLFPYEFLKDLVLVNQKTKEFLKNPSTGLGKELLISYDNAADSYIQDASSKIKILEKDKTDCYLMFVDSVSSCEVAKKDMLTIRENGYKLKEEIGKRKNCLLGKGSCPILPLGETDSFLALLKSINNTKFDLKADKVNFIRETLYSSLSNQSRLSGPYEIKSSCWKNSDSEQWMYLITTIDRDNQISLIPKLANQNYYWRVASGPQASYIDKALLGKGLKYYIQPETTTYECLDLTFYPELLTLDFLEKQIESGAISKENLEKNSDYKLLMENQFGLITPVINTISDHLKIFKSYLIINNAISEPSFLFPVRTAYSIFSFPYAKSIWRIDKKLQYFVSEKEEPLIKKSKNIEIATLDDLEKLGYSNTEIKKYGINMADFLDNILKNKIKY